MRSRFAWIAAGAVAVLALEASGCTQRALAQNGGFGDGKYCAPFKTAVAQSGQAALADPAAAFEDCVHRWGYTLAPARDPADVVAQAAVDACGPVLTAWNQQTLGQDSPDETDRRGRPTMNPQLAERMRAAESRALFYVVQARADSCAPPPANTLFAVGSTPPSNG